MVQANQTVPFAIAATNPNTTKNTTFNKVVKVKMSKLHNEKVEFEKLKETHVSLDDCTADILLKVYYLRPKQEHIHLIWPTIVGSYLHVSTGLV